MNEHIIMEGTTIIRVIGPLRADSDIGFWHWLYHHDFG